MGLRADAIFRPNGALQLYRAVTFHWIHTSGLHLALNLLALADVFAQLERSMSTKTFVHLFVRLIVVQAAIVLVAFATLPR